LSIFSTGATSVARADTQRYLPAAWEAAKWLDASALKTEAGLAWPADPRDPKTVGSTLYAGTPGVVLFYLEAAAASASSKERAAAFLEKAKAGADDLLARLPLEKSCGLYEGMAGIGFALEETFKAAADIRYRKGFLTCLDEIRTRAVSKGTGIEWGTVTDIISGSAGTGLFLLYAAKEIGDKAWLELASRAGRRLIELGRPKNGGLDWAMDPSYPRLMPNFSHGTAGVAFFLARLYAETGKREFLDAALAGGRYLVSIAKTEGNHCLIFHDEPDGKDLYYLGWCHGPVGTANLFYELYKSTRDQAWLDWVLKEAHGLMDSGIPEKQTPGFWNNAGICCGLAGVADFFLGLYKITKNEHHLYFGRRVMTVLDKRATRDASGMRWIQAEHRTRPELLIAQTGLMQGAAGIGLVLLRWAAFEEDKRPVRIRMPDSAF